MDVDTNGLVTNHPGAVLVPTDRRGVGTNLVGRQRHGGRVCGVYLPGTDGTVDSLLTHTCRERLKGTVDSLITDTPRSTPWGIGYQGVSVCWVIT